VTAAPAGGAFLAAAVAVAVLAFVALYRVARGPTLLDRVVGVNAVGTSTVVVVAVLAAALDEPGFLDVALVYALLNFLLSVGLSKYAVERGGVL
jgi:multicomponent Na+:H+ antiporter subunit F